METKLELKNLPATVGENARLERATWTLKNGQVEVDIVVNITEMETRQKEGMPAIRHGAVVTGTISLVDLVAYSIRAIKVRMQSSMRQAKGFDWEDLQAHGMENPVVFDLSENKPNAAPKSNKIEKTIQQADNSLLIQELKKRFSADEIAALLK